MQQNRPTETGHRRGGHDSSSGDDRRRLVLRGHDRRPQTQLGRVQQLQEHYRTLWHSLQQPEPEPTPAQPRAFLRKYCKSVKDKGHCTSVTFALPDAPYDRSDLDRLVASYLKLTPPPVGAKRYTVYAPPEQFGELELTLKPWFEQTKLQALREHGARLWNPDYRPGQTLMK